MVIKRFFTRFRTVKRETGVPHALHKDISIGQNSWNPRKVLLEDFEVIRRLGHGGMGDVYLVKSRSTGNLFAVKRMLSEHSDDMGLRREFMRELLTWVDLPLHPNLTPCHFFRHMDDGGIAIFASFVEGGSLLDWIRGRDGKSLYEGTEKKILTRILDIAIQTAWGLHTIHEQDLIHQDIKPANVLMTPDGIPRITDFGLSRARAKVDDVGTVSTNSSDLFVSSLGYTPAYCSPEQEMGEKLTFKTDIWSWGVMVLEMFTGPAFWKSGSIALQILENHLKNGKSTSQKSPFRMPISIGEVLEKCFQNILDDRWVNLAEVAYKLIEIYQMNKLKEKYNRPTPTPVLMSRIKNFDRITGEGMKWHAPTTWLKKALNVSGQDNAVIEECILSWKGSRKALTIADLLGYEEALTIFNLVMENKQIHSYEEWTQFCIEKALLHRMLFDFHGALKIYDKLILTFKIVGERDHKNCLVHTYIAKSAVLSKLGQEHEAIETINLAIEILQLLQNKSKKNAELKNALAECYQLKASFYSFLGYERNDYDRNRQFAKDSLALALEIRNDLKPSAHTDEYFIAKLAECYELKANLIEDDNPELAGECYMKAIGLLDPLDEKNLFVRVLLKRCYLNITTFIFRESPSLSAMKFWQRSRNINHNLVYIEGRWMYAEDMAFCYSSGGSHLYSLEIDNEADEVAFGNHNKAIEIYDQLVNWEGRSDLRGNMAYAKINRALLLSLKEDQKSKAIDEIQGAVTVLQEEIERTGREDLKRGFGWAKAILSDLVND
jgi:serine/threonine protein kinase